MTALLELAPSTVLLYAVAVAAALIYVPFLVVGYARAKISYDTSAPRAMFDKLPPYAQRATWAHENSFESFMIFSAAALMTYVTGQESTWVMGAAIAYVIARLFYSLFYILDVPIARSLMFGIGSLSIIILFAQSLQSITPT